MRAIVTPEQMRELDRRTIEDLGLPGMVLMELAARGVAVEIDYLLQGRPAGANVLVFCGPGNNGGDGFAVARRLLNLDAEVVVFLLAEKDRVRGDARANMEVFERLGGTIVQLRNVGDLDPLPEVDVIVDAMLGTGLKGGARGLMADVIEWINRQPAPVVAVDIPSGVNGATGAVEGQAVHAEVTVTFGVIKSGLILPPGIEHCGRIVCADIQIPLSFVEHIDPDILLVEPEDIAALLPERSRTTHKGDVGKVLVVAGSVGMTGAAELAARACLRTGSGLVKVATARSAQAVLAGRNAEVMTIPVADTADGTISPAAETTLRGAREWADVEVIGPGLSLNENTVDWFSEHVRDLPLPTVIDADGLNALARVHGLLAELRGEIVLTPHIGEFSRLTGVSVEEISRDRVAAVRKYAAKWGVTLLLKGVPSLIADSEGHVEAVITGNAGMASAGMGDVLTGVIASLMGQGLSGFDAAVAGVNVHGLAGDLAANELGSRGIVAGDVIERLPLAQDILLGRAEYPGGSSCGCGDDGSCGDDCGCDGAGGGCGCA